MSTSNLHTCTKGAPGFQQEGVCKECGREQSMNKAMMNFRELATSSKAEEGGTCPTCKSKCRDPRHALSTDSKEVDLCDDPWHASVDDIRVNGKEDVCRFCLSAKSVHDPATLKCPDTVRTTSYEEVGDYSCAACGFGMKEPCEHWQKSLAETVEPEPPQASVQGPKDWDWAMKAAAEIVDSEFVCNHANPETTAMFAEIIRRKANSPSPSITEQCIAEITREFEHYYSSQHRDWTLGSVHMEELAVIISKALREAGVRVGD